MPHPIGAGSGYGSPDDDDASIGMTSAWSIPDDFLRRLAPPPKAAGLGLGVVLPDDGFLRRLAPPPVAAGRGIDVAVPEDDFLSRLAPRCKDSCID